MKEKRAKEAQFSVNIADHDLEIKCKNIRKWLGQGRRVFIVVQMRGREKALPERAKLLLQKIMLSIQDVAKVAGTLSIQEGAISLMVEST